MDDLAERLTARDRHRKATIRALSYEQRLERMGRLQRASWAMLRASPAGFEQFLRRNFRARSVRRQDDDAS